MRNNWPPQENIHEAYGSPVNTLNSINQFTQTFNNMLGTTSPKSTTNWMSSAGKSVNNFFTDPTKSSGKFFGKFADNLNVGMGAEKGSNLFDSTVNMFKGNAQGGIAGAATSGIKSFLEPTNLGSVGIGLAGSSLDMLGVKKQDTSTMNGFDKTLGFVYKLPLNYIPGVGQGVGLALKGLNEVNQRAGRTSITHGTDLAMDTTGYQKEFNQGANKKHGFSDTIKGWFGKSNRMKTNEKTEFADTMNLTKSTPGYLNRQNIIGSSNTFQSLQDKNRMQLMGGYGTNVILAQLGTKISPVNLRNISNKAEWNIKRKLKELSDKKELETTQKEDFNYKNGGTLTKSDKEEIIEEVTEEKTNVIPEGAFHSRKNNIHEDYAEHVTKKGIPVITKDEEGKVTQHAEVERNEIIFHKEATDTMETLYKKYNEAKTQKLKDEIAIECGKYIANQILVNTDDRTGIIETIE